jgi:hypothetical protein
MSLLFMDGFDGFAYGDHWRKWDWGTSFSYGDTGGRTGGYASNGYCAKYVEPTGSTVIVGFAASGGFSMGASTWATDQYQFTLKNVGSGAIELHRGQNDVLLATSGPGKFKSGWNYIEVKILIDNGAGTAIVKCNSETVINATGLLTRGSSQSVDTWNWVRFNFAGLALDDVYIADTAGSYCNDLLGEVRVVTLLPQTDAVDAGANADFTCSTGTDHGALVDDAEPNDDTDYVYSSTQGHIDTWNYPPVGYTGTVHAVQLSIGAKKTDSGPRAITHVARPTSTNRVDAVDNYLNTSAYNYYRKIYETNPDDSAPWDVADIDGAEFGVKITV